jgi:uncharacterized protein (DUF2141 family)
MKNLLSSLSIIILIVFSQCANQSSPQGGPKDKEAPKLIDSTPADNQTNFKGDAIELYFDEDMKLKDPKEEILITPSAGKDVKFLVKKSKVTIIPKDPWKDSTTYSITFREGVQDITEGNSTENQHFAFSTGQFIDSLTISGSIYEVFKNEIPDKITVAIYQSDTFDITKHAPTYFTKANKEGKFKIQNLKPGIYSIYAFDDKNKNLKVETKTERYGFLSNRFFVDHDIDSFRIPLIHMDARPLKVTNIRHTDKTSKIRFNKAVDSLKITSETPYIATYTFGDTKAEVNSYNKFPKTDSLTITLHATDSAGQSIDTTTYVKYSDNKTMVEQFKIAGPGIDFDPETNKLKIKYSFNKPIRSINLDSIYLQLDSATFQQIKPEETKLDTLTGTLTMNTMLNIAKAKEGDKSPPSPIFILGKAAFISTESDSSKASTKKITIPKESETGTLSIEVSTNEPHYEIQLTSGKEVARKVRDVKSKTFKYLAPLEYSITIIIDSNNNGRWDPGNYNKKIEPEKVIIYKTLENKTGIPIRANWEVGPLLIKF